MQNKYYSYAVADHYEQQKNIKAGGYTIGIAGALLFLMLLIGWKIPKIEPPLVEQGIEVNLGNSDFGSGDIEPTSPGEPAPEQAEQIAATPPDAQPVAEENPSETDVNDKEPAIVKTVEKPKATIKTNDNPPAVKPVLTKVQPAPPQPKPKAQMGQNAGGKGTGGNNQDAFNGVKNQGIAGGNGNQGKVNGNPNSDSYTGNGGAGKGDRKEVTKSKLLKPVKIDGEFTRSATLYVDVKVDEFGIGSFLRVTKGINERQYTSIIKQRLASRDIKFSATGEESTVNIQIVFIVK